MSPIKLLIFDFDGVLADLRGVHYETLNTALAEVDPKFVISSEEHASTFDGLSTKRKLVMLSETKAFPKDADMHAQVFERKQILTIEAIKATSNTISGLLISSLRYAARDI
jgi:beta-phosphoglucomutase-like phosphatase (HAD superfamily)